MALFHLEAQDAHRVEHRERRNADIREHADPHRHEAERDAENYRGLRRQREHDVESDDVHAAPRQADRPRQQREAAAREHRVRRLDRGLRAEADRDAAVRRRKHRRIVHAVADEHAPALHRLHGLCLILRQKPRAVIGDAHLRRHGLRRRFVVAGQHDDLAHTGLFHVGDRRRGVRLHGIRQHDAADRPAVRRDRDRAGRKLRNIHAVLLQKGAAPREDALAPDDRLDAAARDFADLLRLGRIAGGRADRLGNRVRRKRLSRSRELQKRLLGNAFRRPDRGDGERAGCDRAGLVEHDRIGFRQRLEILAALNEHADLRFCADTREEAERHGNHERAGAGGDEHRQRAVQPDRKRAEAQKRRQYRHEDREHKDDRRVNARKAGDELLRVALARRGFLDHAQNAARGRIFKRARDAEHEPCAAVHAAGKHAVARRDLHRHALAGQRRVVDVGAALGDHAVERDALIRVDSDHFVHRNRGRRNDLLGAAAEHARGIGPHLRQRSDAAAGAAFGDLLRTLAEVEQDRDGRRLAELAEAERHDDRDRHQHVLGEIQLDEVLHAVDKNAVARKHGGEAV